MGDLGQIVPVPYSIKDSESIERAVSRSNVAINLVGAPWKTKNYSIPEANIDSAYAIAKVCIIH
jgi:NADH dehydrogenase (ubiquinone) 1 alpha subcomplex subunit 9